MAARGFVELFNDRMLRTQYTAIYVLINDMSCSAMIYRLVGRRICPNGEEEEKKTGENLVT